MRARMHACLLLILALLARQQLQCRADSGQPEAAAAVAAEALDVPPEYIITNSTLGRFLHSVASPTQQAIIFTTTRLPHHGGEGDVAMMSNFCRWLDRAGLLGYTSILTTSNATFHTLHARGLPIYLDWVFPERQEYRDGAGHAGDTPNRVFDVQKHYWGATIVAHGFRALYMDSDAIVLKDPLPWFDAQRYDVQGLSDWGAPELPRVGDVLHASCGLYAMVPEGRVGVGAILREWWRYAPGDKDQALNFHNPCQSTGLWYVEPTPMGTRFMAAMRDRLLAPETLYQWDQTAWNEVIIPFLWGAGDEPPLRYRLLPSSSFFGGVHNYEGRVAAGLPVDPVVLHSGGLHGGAKQATYERLGLFYGNFSLPARPVPGVGGAVSPELNLRLEQTGTETPLPHQALASSLLAYQQQQRIDAAGLAAQGKAVPQLHGVSSSSIGMVALAAVLGATAAAGAVAALLAWRRKRRPLFLELPNRQPDDV